MGRKKLPTYKDRQMIRQEHDIYEEISISEMLKICGNDLTACVETEYSCGDTSLKLVWYTPETDEQMNKRVAAYEADLARWKNREAKRKTKQLEHEKKEYLRLKKKFEKNA